MSLLTDAARRRFAVAAALVAPLVLLWSCASDGSGGPGPDGGPPPMGPQVFVSPFGEPFQSQPGEPYPVATWFSGADTDHDKRLTPDEFASDGQRWFARLDANGDGEIGPSETAAYEAMTAQLFAEQGGFNGPRGGPPQGRGGGRGRGRGGGGRPPMGLADTVQSEGQDGVPGGDPGPGSGTGGVHRRPAPATSALSMAGLLNVPQPVKAADMDTNQRITPQEWARTTDRWFHLLDKNGDGVLTMAELPETAIQRMGGGGHSRGGPGDGRPPR